MDGFVVATMCGRRPVHFMANAKLWRYPLMSTFLDTLGAVPVYPREEHGDAASREAQGDTTNNDAAFARLFSVLEAGSCMGIFPEGNQPHRQPAGSAEDRHRPHRPRGGRPAQGARDARAVRPHLHASASLPQSGVAPLRRADRGRRRMAGGLRNIGGRHGPRVHGPHCWRAGEGHTQRTRLGDAPLHPRRPATLQAGVGPSDAGHLRRAQPPFRRALSRHRRRPGHPAAAWRRRGLPGAPRPARSQGPPPAGVARHPRCVEGGALAKPGRDSPFCRWRYRAPCSICPSGGSQSPRASVSATTGTTWRP